YYILLVFPNNIDTGAVTPKFFNGFPSLQLAGQFECTDCKSNILGSVTFAMLVFFGGYSVINRALFEKTDEANITLLTEHPKNILSESDKNIIFMFLFMYLFFFIIIILMCGFVYIYSYF